MTDSNNYIVYEVRHNGVPVVIEVDIQALIDDTSQLVYESSNGYILTEHVPPKYLKIYKGDKDVSI